MHGAPGSGQRNLLSRHASNSVEPLEQELSISTSPAGIGVRLGQPGLKQPFRLASFASPSASHFETLPH